MKTVLLGDLDSPHRAMLARGLSALGCSLLTASYADEVARLAGRHRFDMIIVDITVLPLGTGRSVVELCAWHPVRPLLVLTCSLPERRWFDTPRPCGFDVRLVKVVDPGSVARRLDAHAHWSAPPRFG